MSIDPGTLALQAINVLVLIWLLSRFLYKPVLAAIAARQAAADKLLADAEAARTAAVAERDALKARASALTADEDRRRAALQAAAEADRKALMDKAAQDIAAARVQAEATLAEERASAGATLQRQAVDLAGIMAAKLLNRLPAVQVSEAMLQALLDKLRGAPAADRARLAASATLQVVTAGPLAPADQNRCKAAIGAELGAPVEPSFRTDPVLIAGFELHAPDILVVNSWRADLQTILREAASAAEFQSPSEDGRFHAA